MHCGYRGYRHKDMGFYKSGLRRCKEKQKLKIRNREKENFLTIEATKDRYKGLRSKDPERFLRV